MNIHKKYIKKGGRTFGPYYYHSYRVGDKIKTKYLGSEPPAELQNSSWLNSDAGFNALKVFSVLIIAGLLLFSLNNAATKITLQNNFLKIKGGITGAVDAIFQPEIIESTETASDSSSNSAPDTPSLQPSQESQSFGSIQTVLSPSDIANCPINLSAYWNLDEGTGSFTADAFGINNGTFIGNTINWSSGKVGNASSFNATDNHFINVNYSQVFNFTKTQGFTALAWVHPASADGNPSVLRIGQSSAHERLVLDISSNAWRVVTRNSGAGFVIISGNAPVLNQWTFLTVTWNGTHINLYENGVRTASDSLTSIDDDSLGLGIGGETDFAGSPLNFNGSIDEVAIFNESLLPAEIEALYNKTLAGAGYCGVGTPLSACGTLNSPNTYYSLTQNVNSAGTCFAIGANNVTLDCQGFTINYSQNTAGYGADITGFSSATIKNCNIVQDSGTMVQNAHGIFFSQSFNSTIRNNNITTNGNISHPIALDFNSGNTAVQNNTLIADGRFSIGLSLSGSSNNTFINNNVTTNSPAVSTVSLLGNSDYNIFRDNSFNANVPSTALSLSSFFSPSPKNNSFTNDRLYTLNSYIEVGNESVNNTLNNVTLLAIPGEVRFPGTHALPNGKIINFSNLNITQNRVFLNSSSDQLAFLNTSAVITLLNLSFSNPQPIVDFQDDGTFQTCSAPQCNNLSYSGGVFVFNVSSFTTYSTQEGFVPLSCGDNFTVANTVYTLTQNVNSSEGCFLVQANNVTLDCQGFMINYSRNTAAGGPAILSIGYNFTTIKNCDIRQEVAAATGTIHAISFIQSNNNTVFNNSITIRSLSAGFSAGVSLVSGSKYNTIRQNALGSIQTGGFNVAEISIESGSNNNIIDYNFINATNSVTILIDSSSDINLSGNYLESTSFVLQTSSANNLSIFNNSLFAKGDSLNAMHLSSPIDSSIINNSILSLNNNAINAFSGKNVRIILNNITGTSSEHSVISIGSGSSRINITSNRITSSVGASKGAINMENSNVTLSSNRISSPKIELNVSVSSQLHLLDQAIGNYTIELSRLIFENGSSGKILFLNSSIRQSGENLSRDIIITNRTVYVNSSGRPGFNTTANITLYNVLFSNPYPFVDLEDDGSFIACNSPHCTELEYSGGTFVFNVSSFTTYSVQETTGVPQICGDLNVANTVYTMTQNVNSLGTCFNVLANNVTLNCQGFIINYSIGGSESYGINATNANDLTIKNCLIFFGNETSNAASNGINLASSNRFSILNNSITANGSNSRLILVQGGDNGTISDNILTYLGSTSIGLMDLSSANNYSITGNSITGQSGIGVIFNGMTNSALINNTFNTGSDSPYSIRFLFGANNNSIINNTLNSAAFSEVINIILSSNDTLLSNNQINSSSTHLTLSASVGTRLVNQDIGGYNFASSSLEIEKTALGNLKFLNSTLTESGTNLSADIQLSFNRTFVNASSHPGFNTTANITLIGLSFTNPQTIVDFNDDGTFETCSAPQCNELSYSGGTFVFNVSSFTTYSTQETFIPEVNISACGTLSTANTLYTLNQSLNSSGTCFNVLANNITLECNGFVINYGTSTSGYGINITSGSALSDIAVRNCKVFKFGGGGSQNYGIYLEDTSNSTIENNNISTNGSALNHGIFAFSSSNDNRINNNTVITNGSSNAHYGIYVYSSSNNNVTNNYVLSGGAPDENRGISVDFNTNNNRVINNSVFISGPRDHGIFIGFSSNIVESNNITVRGDGAYGLNMDFGSDSVYISNRIFAANVSFFFKSRDSSRNNLTNNTFSTESGSVRFPGLMQVPTNVAVNFTNFNLSQNKAFVNGSNLTFLNTSAIITLSGLSFANPQAIVDFQDDGTFETCSAPQCSNLSYSGGTFVFNVSSFTTYSVQEESAQTEFNISACGTLGQENAIYRLNQNVNHSATCFTIDANNVTLDCQEFIINYSKTTKGYGVNVTGYNFTTITNCTILHSGSLLDNSHVIYMSMASNSTIKYNRLYSTGPISYGASLESSPSNTFTNNLITSTVFSGIGTYLGSSSNNIFTDNNISSTSYIGIYLTSSSNNIFTNNDISSISGNSAYLSSNSNYNNLTNNRITSTIGDSTVLESSSNNIFTNNDISSTSGISTYLISSSNNNTFTNNNLAGIAYSYIVTTSGSAGNNMTNNTLTGRNSSIRHPQTIIIPSNIDVSKDKLNISFNRVFLNSTNLTFLNTSAVISLSGLGFSNPQPLVDFQDDGTFETCSAPQCNNLSYSGGTFVFNVSSFTTYSVQEFVQEFSPNLTACGNLTQENVTYLLQNDVVSSQTCFNVTANNIILDCAGNSISVSATNANGIELSSVNNVTLMNCDIDSFNGNGITFYSSTRSLLFNSTITDSYIGVSLISSGNNTLDSSNITEIANVAVELSSSSSDNIVTSSNISSANNAIAISSGTGNQILSSRVLSTNGNGIFLFSGSSGTIISDNFASGIGSAIGIASNNNIIASNNLSVYANNANGLLLSSVSGNTIYENIISTGGNNTVDGGYGIRLESSSSNSVFSNNISTLGSSAYALYLSGGLTANVIENNSLSTSGQATALLLFNGANRNNFTKNIITTINGGIGTHIISSTENNYLGNLINSSTSITVEGSLNTSFFNNSLVFGGNDFTSTNSNGTLLQDQAIGFYNIRNSSFKVARTQIAELILLNDSVSESGSNFSGDIVLSNNLILVNSTLRPGFNTSANLTLHNLTFTSPQIIVDFQDDGTFETCSAPRCSNLSYNGSTFVFNVSSFTTYSVQEEVAQTEFNLTSCGVLDVENATYTLTQGVSTSSTCMYVNATNVTLNCGGFEINGTDNGFGVDNAGTAGDGCPSGSFGGCSYVTVKNCKINTFTSGIDFQSASNGVIINNVISNVSGQGVNLQFDSNSNTVSLNNITSPGTGISVGGDSNTIFSNQVNITSAGTGINMVGEGRFNVFASNIIIAAGGAGMGISGSANIVSSNVIRTFSGSGLQVIGATNLSENNTFFFNDIFGGIVGSHGALALFDTEGNVFEGDLINATSGATAINFRNNASGNSFRNVRIISDTEYISLSGNRTGNNTLVNGTISNNHGNVTWMGQINLSNDLSEFNVLNFNISNNRTYLNSSRLQDFNASAVITLFNLGVTSPQIIVDYNDDGAFEVCDTPQCTGISYSGGVAVFNVSSFTTYSVQEEVTTLTCGDLDTANTEYTLTQNVDSAGTCFNVRANNVTLDCLGFTINFSNSISGVGVNVTGFNNATIKDCVIVNGNSSVNSVDGVLLSSSLDNEVIDTDIDVDGQSSTAGIHLLSSSGNLIFQTLIVTHDNGESIGLELFGNNNNNFTKNKITSQNNYILMQGGSGNTITNNTFFQDDSEVRFPGTITLALPAEGVNTLSDVNFEILFNKTKFNSTLFSFMNTSAEITFHNLNFIAPRIIVDLEDDDTFSTCSAPQCNNLSYNGSTFIFNVSHFTTYAAQETSPALDCGTLGTANTVYNLTQSVSSSGGCFIITAENVTLDCRGYNVTYGTGAVSNGIVAEEVNGTVIQNCNVVSGPSGVNNILINNVTGMILRNNTIFTPNMGGGIFPVQTQRARHSSVYNNNFITNNTAIGFFSLGGYGLNISNNTFTTNGDAIHLKGNTTHSWIYGNNITTNGTDAIGIYLFEDSSNSTIIANTIFVHKAARGALIDSSNNTLRDNNITTFVDGSDGISLAKSRNAVIGNTINTSGVNSEGIEMSSSDFNRIQSNIVYTNDSKGISVSSSINNTIAYNFIKIDLSSGGSAGNGGLSLSSSSNSTNITGNMIEIINNPSSSLMGLEVSFGSNNVLFENIINVTGSSTCCGDGIRIEENSANNTASYNRIMTNGTSADGFRVSFNVSGNTLFGNYLTTFNTGSSIHVHDSGDGTDHAAENIISNNTIIGFGTGGGISITAENNTFTNNTITENGNSLGVFVSGTKNTLLVENKVIQLGNSTAVLFINSNNTRFIGNNVSTTSSTGIAVRTFSKFSTIANNSITVNGNAFATVFIFNLSSGTNVSGNVILSNSPNSNAINVLSGSNNNLISRNNITTNRQNVTAIAVSTLNNNLERNVLNLFGNNTAGLQVSFNASGNNYTDNIVIITTSSASALRIRDNASNNIYSRNNVTLLNSSNSGVNINTAGVQFNNTLRDNYFLINSTDGLGIGISTGENNTFVNNIIEITSSNTAYSGRFISVSSTSLGNTMLNTSIVTRHGSVKNTQTVTIPANIRLSPVLLNISSNFVYLNSSDTNSSFLNSSAIITIDNLALSVPKILVDFNDDGVFADCSAPQCNNLSYNGSTLVFNVTGFTAYKANETPVADSSPAPSSGGGGGGGGSSRAAVNDTATQCNEDWQCEEWSACVSGKQTRLCSDKNKCGTVVMQPAYSRTCESRTILGEEIQPAPGTATRGKGIFSASSLESIKSVKFIAWSAVAALTLIFALSQIVRVRRKSKMASTINYWESEAEQAYKQLKSGI